MDKLYFISDAHLGAQNDEQEELKKDRFLSFLHHVHNQNADLIIVGDLFDFWFEYKHVIPRQHFHILARLDELTAKQPVHYMAGNHDFWMDSFMEQEIGLIVHPDDFITEKNGLKIYLRHGDGLLIEDKGYRFLKRILRNRLNIKLYRLLHPDVGIPLALAFSHKSRESGKNDIYYSDEDYREFAREKIQEGFDLVVLGHTHVAALEKYGHGWYLNPGNWMEDFTFGVLQHGKPALYQWDGKHEIRFEQS